MAERDDKCVVIKVRRDDSAGMMTVEMARSLCVRKRISHRINFDTDEIVLTVEDPGRWKSAVLDWAVRNGWYMTNAGWGMVRSVGGKDVDG